MPMFLNAKDADFETAFVELLHMKRETEQDVNDVVQAILKDVQTRGNAAVLEYTHRFDRLELTAETMRLSDQEVEDYVATVPGDQMAALQEAAERIHAFHSQQMPNGQDFTDAAGVRLGAIWKSVEAAGLYVPGGTAAYPSSVLMNAMPAKVAGVDRIAMVVPTPDGVVNPLVLAAAKIAGVTEIYRIGGAQAVAALAYGTETIEPVSVIVGPGNAFVAAAKRQVYGTVGIDMIAGPSEILVVADKENDPSWLAVDLLSQAEHDTAAQSILIVDDEAFGKQVAEAVETTLKTLDREDIARTSWEENGAIVTVDSLEDAVPLINRIAPEHLEIATAEPWVIGDQVRNAGAMFMGRYTPEAIGDYVAGPNHVLPTARSARFSSGLSVMDFLKRTTFVQCSQDSIDRIGPAAVTLAKAEGLGAHARSVAVRLGNKS